MRTLHVPPFPAMFSMTTQSLGHCRGARLAPQASVIARRRATAPHSVPACVRTLKSCVPFPFRGISGRRRRLHVVSFRTEDASETPPQNAIVIGLDFYRCFSAAFWVPICVDEGLITSRRPTRSVREKPTSQRAA